MNILQLLKDIIAPKKCYSCGIEGHFLCNNCRLHLNDYVSCCYVCKNNSYHFEVHELCKEKVYYDKVIIVTHYRQTIIKKLIKDFKFHSKKDIGEDFISLLSDKLDENIDLTNKDEYLITGIPVFILKLFKRGYNQSYILGKGITKQTGLTYCPLLVKWKYTRQQSHLNKKERGQNLSDSFKIKKNQGDKVDKKRIIILDDVISTGGTLNEAAKVLKQNGALEVIGLIIASD